MQILYLPINNKKNNIMEPAKKNKPAPIVVIGIAALVIAIVSYFIIMMFFPDLFNTLPKGDSQPITPN